MRRADLEYVFKTKTKLEPFNYDDKSDSSSYEKIKNKINSSLSSKGSAIFRSYDIEDVALQEYRLDTKLEQLDDVQTEITERVRNINDLIRTRLVQTKYKLEKSRDIVKQAMLSEKKLVGETYTAFLPLDKEYTTSKTTATIEDGVVLGVGYEEESKTGTELDLSTIYLIGEETTQFKIISDQKRYPLKIELEKNLYNPYNQIKVVIPSIIESGILFIKFKNVEAFSILNKDGYEIVERKLSDTVKFTVDKNDKTFSLRFMDNNERILEIESLYFTEKIFNKKTVFETTPFIVGKDFSYLSIETCDNFNSPEVDMKYEISINGEEYQEFRPSGKIKGKAIQSIIKTDKYGFSAPILLENPVIEDGVYKFYTDQPMNVYSRIKLFSLKQEDDFKSLETFLENKEIKNLFSNQNDTLDKLMSTSASLVQYTYDTDDKINVHIAVKKDFDFVLHEDMEVVLDGVTYTHNNTEKGLISIKKGLHTLTVNKNDWKELVNLNDYKIKRIDEEELIVVNRNTTEEIKVPFYFNPYEKQHSSVYLQLWKNEVDVFLLKEEVKRKYDRQYVEYFYKNNPYKMYLYNESPSNFVQTVQIKLTMNPVSQLTSPYVSSITLRGI